MDEIEIFWTNTALKQRNFVLFYWSEHNKSKEYSIKLRSEIIKRISLLKTNPHIGKSTNYKTTRVLMLGFYSIFYKVVKNKIFITGFWDNRQDPEKLVFFLNKEQ